MAPRYEHTGNAVPTQLLSTISASATTINIVAPTGWPTGAVGSFWAVIEPGTANEEKILCTSRTAGALTVLTRGADGTTASSHAATSAIMHVFSATEADDANALTSQVTSL